MATIYLPQCLLLNWVVVKYTWGSRKETSLTNSLEIQVTNGVGLRRAETRATGLACTLTILHAGGRVAPAARAPFYGGSAGGAGEGQDTAGRGAGGSRMGSSHRGRAHQGGDPCRISAHSNQRVSAARCAGAGDRRLNPVRRQEWTAGACV
jgi:hypothetical protein